MQFKNNEELVCQAQATRTTLRLGQEASLLLIPQFTTISPDCLLFLGKPDIDLSVWSHMLPPTYWVHAGISFNFLYGASFLSATDSTTQGGGRNGGGRRGNRFLRTTEHFIRYMKWYAEFRLFVKWICLTVNNILVWSLIFKFGFHATCFLTNLFSIRQSQYSTNTSTKIFSLSFQDVRNCYQ